MNIGILGSGNVGGILGTRWAAAGHTITFGSRNPASAEMRDLVSKAGGNATAATNSDTAATSDILLIATPWMVTQQVLASAGDLNGKILIDATNPLLPDLSGLELGNTTSAAEQIAAWAPGAKVVKAFNTIGANIMANPAFASRAAILFYCGDDTPAKQLTHQLATEIGFNAYDAGPLRQARVLEPFALLWISLAFAGGREIGFDLLRR